MTSSNNILLNLSGQNITYDTISSSSEILPISSTDSELYIHKQSMIQYHPFELYTIPVDKKEIWKNLIKLTSENWDKTPVSKEINNQRD